MTQLDYRAIDGEDNILILNKVLHMLNRYSFDRDVTREENALIARLMRKVATITMDYVHDFKPDPHTGTGRARLVLNEKVPLGDLFQDHEESLLSNIS